MRGAVTTALRLGVSPLIIGLTVVGFGTSFPELVTNLQAAYVGSPGLAIGNVVGSNIVNILLILGLTAIITPIKCNPKAFYRDGSVMIIATFLIIGVFFTGEISRISGIVFVCVLIGYIFYAYYSEKVSAKHVVTDSLIADIQTQTINRQPFWRSLLFVFGGLVIMVIGAHFVVSASISLAHYWGISDTIIGLTVVAIGTSLPELVTSVMASIRKQSDVAFGNIVGSNIYNLLGILGLTATIHPIAVPIEIVHKDMWIMVAATLIMTIFATTGWSISRREGFALMSGYLIYSIFLII